MLHHAKHRTLVGSIIVRTVTALVVVTALAGCGDSETSSGQPSAARTAPNGDVYNTADVRFAQQMIPHHAQAIAMADLTRQRDLSPEVAQLAAGILEAQTPEIESMTDWLTSWNEEVPETMRDHANAHGEGSGEADESDLPGMMSQEDMDALASASDAEFEDLWLTMMIEHHTGAIELAREQQAAGAFAPAVDLAEDIEAGQTAEVQQLRELTSG